jgi:phosphopantothenoylcysteine synthetase/decarboxylase
MTAQQNRPVVYLIVCATPRAKNTGHLVGLLHGAGWDVCVVVTPQALDFIDAPALETLTGHPVRSRYKKPDEPDVLPRPDAMVVCPATFNTVNKWAAGISDTLALGLITEAIGLRIPLIAAPSLNDAQASHPAFARSVAELRDAGVTVLYGPSVYEPTPPRTGGRAYDWQLILDALPDAIDVP